MDCLKRYLRDDSGQTSIEYILMLAVVALIIFKFKDSIETKIEQLLTQVFGKIDTLTNF